MTTTQINHNALVSLIIQHGEYFPKKHGHWVKLHLNDSWFLELDSWNRNIILKQGTGEPRNKELAVFNDVCGFKGKVWMSLGMNFGAFTGESKSGFGLCVRFLPTRMFKVSTNIKGKK